MIVNNGRKCIKQHDLIYKVYYFVISNFASKRSSNRITYYIHVVQEGPMIEDRRQKALKNESKSNPFANRSGPTVGVDNQPQLWVQGVILFIYTRSRKRCRGQQPTNFRSYRGRSEMGYRGCQVSNSHVRALRCDLVKNSRVSARRVDNMYSDKVARLEEGAMCRYRHGPRCDVDASPNPVPRHPLINSPTARVISVFFVVGSRISDFLNKIDERNIQDTGKIVFTFQTPFYI